MLPLLFIADYAQIITISIILFAISLAILAYLNISTGHSFQPLIMFRFFFEIQSNHDF
jgi:hypothetical protein